MNFQDFLREEVAPSSNKDKANKLRAKLKQARADLKDMSVTPHSEAAADAVDDARQEVKRLEQELASLTESEAGEWCLVMANGKVTGNTCSSKGAASALQKKAPVATEIKYGKRAADGTFVAVKSSPLTEVSGYDAKAAYEQHLAEFNQKIGILRGLARHHSIRQTASGSWGFVGDMASVNERLDEIIALLREPDQDA